MIALDAVNVMTHSSRVRSHADRIIRACAEVIHNPAHGGMTPDERSYIVRNLQLLEIEIASIRVALSGSTAQPVNP